MRKILLWLFILLIVLCGFSIKINSLKIEWIGLIELLRKILF